MRLFVTETECLRNTRGCELQKLDIPGTNEDGQVTEIGHPGARGHEF